MVHKLLLIIRHLHNATLIADKFANPGSCAGMKHHSNLDYIMIAHKDVHGLDVTVDDFGSMQGLQAFTDLHEVFPDDLFWESFFQLIPLLDEST